METYIRDPYSNNAAKVSTDNRLATISITETEENHATDLGDKYNFNTGQLTLTSANESACLYIKNNESNDLIISAFIYNIGNSTGSDSSADYLVDIIRNPTTGTIVSDATSVDINSNMNYGSNKTFVGNVYKGGEGKTITDGTRSVSSVIKTGGRYVISLGAIVIPKGSSIGVTIQPPTGTTNVVVQVAASAYVKNFDL